MKARAIARAEMRIDYVKLVILSGALVGSWAVFAPLVYAAARAFRTLIGCAAGPYRSDMTGSP